MVLAMKTFIFAVAVFLSLRIHSVHAASQEEEARFLAAAKTAIEKNDADALMALEQKIDAHVYRLYRLTKDEVKLVEESAKR